MPLGTYSPPRLSTTTSTPRPPVQSCTRSTKTKYGFNFQGNRNTHPELRHLDRSYSGSDIRHRVAASAVYELPFGAGRRFDVSNGVLNALAGGWGLGVIAEIRTGWPYAIVENTDRS